MEMEPIHSDDMDGFADESSEQLNSPYTSYLNGLNGEPEILPRVGDQYQADIPEEEGCLKLISCYVSNPHLHNPITFGLPIPLMWTRSEKFRGFREAESEKERQVTPTSGSNTPSSNVSIENDETAVSSKQRSIVLALPCQRIAKFKYEYLDKSLYPFPGTLGESWEEAERERFLLGLYCLGKNLVLVQRFVESKKMGDILSYYYGKFYRTAEYQRWVDGRKLRSRRSVQGQKLFQGWRQQELLSRISSNVSEECKSTLLKLSKEFREEKMDVEEYVMTLKNTVGINMLTEAIGLGKGKKDLTSYASEPPKSNYATSGNSEVPKDIAWSSLSLAEIVRYLTGGFRLSKNRSSHLFWEAVWPRLLERGWHSEQPKGRPNNSLVYLIPEANKFSRRRMTKGNHYFDSLTDVLNKVASDPTLLELESDVVAEKGSREEVIKNVPLIKLEKFDHSSPYSKKQRYLQPRKTCKSQEVLKFTIVDTSKAHGVEECTLIELRHLPDESGGSIAVSPCYLSDSGDSLSDESENEVETTAKSMASRVCGNSSVRTSEGSLSSGRSSSVNTLDNVTSRSTSSLDERQQENQKGRPRNPKLLPVCAKRSSLAACSFSESDNFVETQPRKKKTVNRETQMRPNPSAAHQNVVMRDENIDQSLKPSSTSSFVEGSSCERKEDRSSIQGEMSPQGPETREDFDLNVSQISIEHEADGTVMTDTVQYSESSCAEQSSVHIDLEMQYKPHELLKEEVTTDLHSGRRQSTRNRPLTTKALEAFAFGYLGNSKKKRKVSEEPRSRSRPKSTKRFHSHTVVTSDFRNGTVNDSLNSDENE